MAWPTATAGCNPSVLLPVLLAHRFVFGPAAASGTSRDPAGCDVLAGSPLLSRQRPHPTPGAAFRVGRRPAPSSATVESRALSVLRTHVRTCARTGLWGRQPPTTPSRKAASQTRAARGVSDQVSRATATKRNHTIVECATRTGFQLCACHGYETKTNLRCGVCDVTLCMGWGCAAFVPVNAKWS